jgi:hypothetical protein
MSDGTIDEEEEFLDEIVDGVVDQFLQEFKQLLAEVFLEPDSLSLPQPTEVEGSPPPKPPKTEEEYRTYVWNFIEKNLSAFYEPGDPFVEDIVQKAALRAQELTTTYHLAPETTPKLVKLALYDFVILCGKVDHYTSDRLSSSPVIAEIQFRRQWFDENGRPHRGAERYPSTSCRHCYLFTTVRDISSFSELSQRPGF